MLQSIRDKAQGWIAWAIVILLSIPFALFGIEEYLGGGGVEIVAEVDDTEISKSMLKRKISNFREGMRQNLGDNYQQELFEGKKFELQILDQLINETVIDKTVKDWNLRASDSQVSAYIRNIESFQNQGKFDKQLYDSAVRSRGLSSAGFEDFIRQDLVISQFESGLKNTSFVSKNEVLEFFKLMNQKRHIGYIRIPKEKYYNISKVNDEDAKAFYDTKVNKYLIPERVKIAYIKLDLELLSEFVEVSEEDLYNYFLQNEEDFIGYSEREVSHILIGQSLNSESERLKRSQEILSKLKKGENFSELARKFSDDSGSAKNGGRLGWLSKGVMPDQFENEAFSLKVGQYSNPIKTNFGYHIITVTNEQGKSDITFEDVREKVMKSFISFQSEELFYEYFERLATAAYEEPTSLDSASQVINAKIKKTGWLTRSGTLPPDITNQKTMNSIFSDDVLINGNNSEVIEMSPTEAIVLRVVDHEKKDRLPFENVKSLVVSEVAQEIASSEAKSKGELFLSLLKGGESLDNLAKSKALIAKKAIVTRYQGEIPKEILKQVFEQPLLSSKNPNKFGVISKSGDYYLISLHKIEDSKNQNLSASDLIELRKNFSINLGSYELNELLKNKRSQLSVEINLEK